jgi:hypothetical protein
VFELVGLQGCGKWIDGLGKERRFWNGGLEIRKSLECFGEKF